MYEQKPPRYYFKEGFLWVYGDRETRIRLWPDPVAEERYNRYNFWRDLEPTERLIKPYRKSVAKKKKSDPSQVEIGFNVPTEQPPVRTPAQKKKWAYDRLRFTLPKDVAGSVERFHSHQWGPLLMVHHHGQPALDLLENNPVLAYVLANSKGYQKMMRNPRTRKLTYETVTQKQRIICGCIKFPAERWMVKLFNRIHPASACRDLLVALRSQLGKEEVKRKLGHLDTINRSVLEILADESLQGLISDTILQEVSAVTRDRYYPYIARKLQDLRFMYKEVYPDKSYPSFKRLDRYLACYKDLSENFVKRFGKLKCIAFPRPPIDGTDYITPITSATELQNEGDRQHHCIASYAEQVANGNMYVYKVTAPQRATLAIVPRPGGGWRRKEMKCHSNNLPGWETTSMVDAWLAQGGFN